MRSVRLEIGILDKNSIIDRNLKMLTNGFVFHSWVSMMFAFVVTRSFSEGGGEVTPLKNNNCTVDHLNECFALDVRLCLGVKIFQELFSCKLCARSSQQEPIATRILGN